MFKGRPVVLGVTIGLVAVIVTAVIIRFTSSGSDDVDSIDLTGTEVVAQGDPFPEAKLTDLNGDKVSIDDYAGKPVVVNIWAESCRPCREEMPAFQSVYAEHQGDVAFLGINSGDDVDVTAKYVSEVGVTYDIARDPRADVISEVGGPGLPTTLFVSSDGRVLDVHFGAMTADELEGAMAKDFAAA